MPLNEDEQRILRQIEEQLQRDPNFGRDMHRRGQPSRRIAVLSCIASVVLVAVSVLLLSVNPYLSFVAFVAALVAVVFAERHVRAIGEAGLSHLGESVRSRLGGHPGPTNSDI